MRPRTLEAEFTRVCYPLYSATPGWAEESRQFLARMIRNTDVAGTTTVTCQASIPGACSAPSGAPSWSSPAKTTRSARCP